MLLGAIPHLREVRDSARVSVKNAANATYCIDGQGQVWVRKRVINTKPHVILAESVAWLLAHAVDVAIPDAAIVDDESGRSWLSRLVEPVGHWNPAFVPEIVNMADLGGVIALDALLLNEDRHIGNILVQATDESDELRVHGIDYGAALAGLPADFAAAGVDEPALGENLAVGIPVELVSEAALATALRARTIGASMLRGIASEACEIAASQDAATLERALHVRCGAAPHIVARYLVRLRARE